MFALLVLILVIYPTESPSSWINVKYNAEENIENYVVFILYKCVAMTIFCHFSS